MDSGYYAAFAGLLARTEALDSAASNLSNANTNGFRAEREYFRSAIVGPHAPESQVNRTVNNYGVLGGNHIDLGQGPLTHTGNPMDAAIEGEGFFSIKTTGGLRFTRDGNWLRASDGTLTTSRGEPVLDTAGKPIRVPTGEIGIGADGVVSVGGAAVAQLGVYRFAPSELIPEGTNSYATSTQHPAVAKGYAIHQGSLESSNQDIVQGSLQLVLVQRQAEMMQKALSIFNTNFDKTASEDLPRV